MDGRIVFVMLNPSTADASVDDPTIRRLIGFAKAWGYDFTNDRKDALISECGRFRYSLVRGPVEVVNLYAYRTKSPAELKKAGWLIGPDNDRQIVAAVEAPECHRVIAAWGANAQSGRVADVLRMIRAVGRDIYHLGLGVTGVPKHPLYIKGDTTPTLWLSAEIRP